LLEGYIRLYRALFKAVVSQCVGGAGTYVYIHTQVQTGAWKPMKNSENIVIFKGFGGTRALYSPQKDPT
jgi:hypothetical protein